MTARGDGLGAIYSEVRAVATRLDRDMPGAGQALRDEAEGLLRALMDRRRAMNRRRSTTTTTTTTTTRGAGTPQPPLRAEGRA